MVTVLKKPISIFKTILDVVFPPVCYVCGKACSSKYGLCDSCQGNMKLIAPPYCPKCGRKTILKETTCGECNPENTNVTRAWSCCYYEDTVKECVHLFKYSGYLGLGDIFRDLMSDFIKNNMLHKDIDLLVPVPVYHSKKRERGYNHAEILTRNLSTSFLIPMDSKNLKKIRWTRSQSELDRKKRLKNVKDSFFAVDKDVFRGKNVLLVDDVYTTGSTINECAGVLREAGARDVFSLTLARGI